MTDHVSHKKHAVASKPKAPVKSPKQEAPLTRLQVFRFAETALDELGLDPKITPHLLTAVAYPESTFRPSAKGSNQATGLIQIKPESADDYGVHHTELTNPVKNLQVGAQYLNDLLTAAKGNLKEALQRYKCGDKAFKEAHCTQYADRIIHAAQHGTPDPALDASGKVAPWHVPPKPHHKGVRKHTDANHKAEAKPHSEKASHSESVHVDKTTRTKAKAKSPKTVTHHAKPVSKKKH